MKPMNAISEIRELLIRADDVPAADLLLDALRGREDRHYKEAILHRAKLSRIDEQQRKGVLTGSDAESQRGAVRLAILELLDIIERCPTTNGRDAAGTGRAPDGDITVTHPERPQQKRLRQLEILLDLEQEKLFEFERELTLAAGADQRVAIRQRIKHDISPRLREYGDEYAALLAGETPEEAISDAEAEPIVAELQDAAGRVEEYRQAHAPQEMIRLLEEINATLNKPGGKAGAKLKLSLPIIPALASYEIELDTKGVLMSVWRKTRELFGRLSGGE